VLEAGSLDSEEKIKNEHK
jgi:hypothetical protein